MPEGTRVHRCVEKVKAKGGGVNPYAVCQASTGQSFATGKSKTKEGKPVGGKKSKSESVQRSSGTLSFEARLEQVLSELFNKG